MKNLFLKLGFFKISFDDFLVKLSSFIDEFTDLILNSFGQELVEKEKSRSEVKIFLWIYIAPFLKEELPDDYFTKTMIFFREHIVFEDILFLDLDENKKLELIKSRDDIHNDGIENLMKGKGDFYYKQLDLIFFLKPFYIFSENQKAFPISFDPIRGLKINSFFNNLFSKMLPLYVDFIKRSSSKIKFVKN